MPENPIPILSSSDSKKVERVFKRRTERLEQAERTVRPILTSVRREGDSALVRYSRRWDGFTGSRAKELKISAAQISAAVQEVTPDFRRAVRQAARNIRAFCRLQMPRQWHRSLGPGIRAGQLVRPLESVGCYIPAGRYPLPSTLLMTAIPAQVAGVPRIVVCTPRPVGEILAVAGLLGIGEIYAVGGAPAVGAMAYGTKLIPPVRKIVGPGNAYVAAAKRIVARDAAVEFIAGPTEVLIIADKGKPNWLAADLLAQAEHDTDAAAILLTASKSLANQVAGAVEKQLATLPKTSPAAAALRANGAIIIVRHREEAIELANRFSPEHLSVPVGFPLEQIQNAGSVFVGPYSPEAAGDYASGPNHVLPTSGVARLRGGLSVLDFVKIISVQKLQPQGLGRIAPVIISLARAEGLEAHARSVEIRLNDYND